MRDSEDRRTGRLRAGSRRGAACLAAVCLAACGDATGPDPTGCVVEEGGAAARLALMPGEICAVAAEDAGALVLPGSPESARYLVAVQSASRVAGATASLRFELEGAAGTAPAGSRTSPSAAPVPEPEHPRFDLELRFRRNARLALRDARPLRAGADPSARGGGRAAFAPAERAAAPGDTVVFTNTVDADLNVDCQGLHDITAVVKGVGEEIGIVEDVEASGPVEDLAYAGLLETLEELVFPVDTAYFGAPADLDGNGIVWMLFTPVVNRATPRGSLTRIAGFFNPSDLSDPATCPGSNRGELLYLLAADPDGRFSDPVGPEFATTRALGVAAHELEHLISAERRIVKGGGSFADLEDAWLGEGLAHSAETAVGLRAAGLAPGGNHDFAGLSADRPVFDTYHLANFRRAGFYLNDTDGTPALGNMGGGDPGGMASLRMRGFAWLLLRWFADQYAPEAPGLLGGPREEALFRDLAGGGGRRDRGIDNLERVAAAAGGPSAWAALLDRWALVPLADDAPGVTDPAARIPSLDLPDLFAGLNAEFGDRDPFRDRYPLTPTHVTLRETTSVGIDFDISAAAGRYFDLESQDGHPEVRVALTTPAGSAVPASARTRLVLQRIR